MLRRIVALVGIVVLLLLAATLLWQVYLRHEGTDPDGQDEPATVRDLRRFALPHGAAASAVGFALDY